jgi:hypothetical protein
MRYWLLNNFKKVRDHSKKNDKYFCPVCRFHLDKFGKCNYCSSVKVEDFVFEEDIV